MAGRWWILLPDSTPVLLLDEAASEGMSLAQPLPPIPDHLHTERVDEHFEVTFGAAPVPEKRAMSLCGS